MKTIKRGLSRSCLAIFLMFGVCATTQAGVAVPVPTSFGDYVYNETTGSGLGGVTVNVCGVGEGGNADCSQIINAITELDGSYTIANTIYSTGYFVWVDMATVPSELIPTTATSIFYNNNIGQLGNSVITDADFGFQAVPVPAAVWLFGSGLLGLLGVARRKRVL